MVSLRTAFTAAVVALPIILPLAAATARTDVPKLFNPNAVTRMIGEQQTSLPLQPWLVRMGQSCDVKCQNGLMRLMDTYNSYDDRRREAAQGRFPEPAITNHNAPLYRHLVERPGIYAPPPETRDFI